MLTLGRRPCGRRLRVSDGCEVGSSVNDVKRFQARYNYLQAAVCVSLWGLVCRVRVEILGCLGRARRNRPSAWLGSAISASPVGAQRGPSLASADFTFWGLTAQQSAFPYLIAGRKTEIVETYKPFAFGKPSQVSRDDLIGRVKYALSDRGAAFSLFGTPLHAEWRNEYEFPGLDRAWTGGRFYRQQARQQYWRGADNGYHPRSRGSDCRRLVVQPIWGQWSERAESLQLGSIGGRRHRGTCHIPRSSAICLIGDRRSSARLSGPPLPTIPDRIKSDLED